MEAAEPLSFAERSLLVRVARMFYLEDRSKVEIAAELGISRFKIARLLDEAHNRGVVTIALDDRGTPIPELAAALTERLGLEEVVVVESDPDDGGRLHVALAAAELLRTTLRDGDVLGMSWGRTLTAMTEQLTALPAVSVVQLTGTVGSDLNQSPVEIVRKLASAAGGSAYPVFTPMVVSDAGTAEALKRQSDVAPAIRMFSDVSCAVLALGSWDPLESQLAASLPEKEREELTERGVIAEMASTLIDRNGELIAPDFTAKTIAIGAAELRRVPRVVLVSSGASKCAAARAALRAGIVTGLVTDRVIAESLLADEGLVDARRKAAR